MATDAMKSQVAAKWQEAFQRLNGDSPGISGLMKFSEAWAISVQFLYPWDISSVPVDVDGRPYGEILYIGKDLEAARPAFNVVNRSKKLPALLETFLDDVRKNFYLVENEITQYMARYEEHQSTDEIRGLISRLVEWYRAWAPPPDLGAAVFQSYTLNFQTRLFSALPPSFTGGFKNLCATLLSPPSAEDAIVAVWRDFDILGLIERYETIIASVGYEYIEEYVLRTCTGEWGKPMLDDLRIWMSEKVVPWLLHVYARGATTPDEARTMLQGVGSRFDFHINKTLCDLRTREIFDVIIDYPDSMGALQDLRDCMQRVDQRADLVAALRKQNQKRLLNPGADTKLILQQYVSTIKCLRIVDPPGVLLFKVADPIRRYLRDRPDTIRSIVANLVGDDDDENGESLVDDVDAVPIQQHDFDDYSDPNWEPEPIDAGPEFRANKPSDVISTLVSIYDSKDLFVKELQVLLAQRLLMITKDGSDRVEKERKNIEILKIRFGESALQVCEVMLRDMTDSKRINTHVQAQKSSRLQPTIISRHFWPALESSDLVMPGQFHKLQEDYAHEFNVFKPDKKLKWLPHLGTVQLELELEDRKVQADVPPLEAAFIELFSDKPVWTLDELIVAVGSVNRSAAIKALSTWVDLGVLKEDPENTFNLLEKAEEGQSAAAAARERDTAKLVAPIADIPALSGTQLQQAEQMRVYWKFIEGMLTNLGGLPLDRIQTMLKFAPGYDKTIEQLASFLEAARREGHLVVRDGVWRLNPGHEA
ncbi:ubiquitin-protein ligase [Gymnopilus junonius]|uniref:Anaphase-promoting complex subunit 2 n=1 Tax=Gymnopilus junonius TaxID=109634 RepID=A0A9P5NG66_GYMJU|nr:ubiquitin-protein ligase [Gymnopilus junonius]